MLSAKKEYDLLRMIIQREHKSTTKRQLPKITPRIGILISCVDLKEDHPLDQEDPSEGGYID